MSHDVSITDAARHFDEYIERVISHGERFVLLRENKPVAELRPVQRGRTFGELVQALQSGPHLTPEEAESFAADLERFRAEGPGALPPRDPWES